MVGDKKLREESMDFFTEQARELGDIALKYFRNLEDDQVGIKPGTKDDPITVADLEISERIVPAVASWRPNALLLTEETARTFPSNLDQMLRERKPLVIVDELDGTRNYRDGKEDFSMPLALAEHTQEGYQVTAGVVYKPVTGEFYLATIDTDPVHVTKAGVKSKLGVSGRAEFVQAATPINVAVGRETFPETYPEEYLRVADVAETVRERNPQIWKAHRFSCALEMIDVARGEVDVYMNAKAANWDYAAASLILRQAGGKGYLLKNLQEPQPWSLQLQKPSAYFPALFTNGEIDEEFFDYLRGLENGA